MDWLLNNKRELFEVVLAAHAVAMLVVNLTPTPKDDEAVSNAGAMLRHAYRALEILAGVVTPLVKH